MSVFLFINNLRQAFPKSILIWIKFVLQGGRKTEDWKLEGCEGKELLNITEMLQPEREKNKDLSVS